MGFWDGLVDFWDEVKEQIKEDSLEFKENFLEFKENFSEFKDDLTDKDKWDNLKEGLGEALSGVGNISKEIGKGILEDIKKSYEDGTLTESLLNAAHKTATHAKKEALKNGDFEEYEKYENIETEAKERKERLKEERQRRIEEEILEGKK